MELLLLHLDNKGVLLWRDEPVGVKTVHTDELLGGGLKLVLGLQLMRCQRWQVKRKCKTVKSHLEAKPSVVSPVLGPLES